MLLCHVLDNRSSCNILTRWPEQSSKKIKCTGANAIPLGNDHEDAVEKDVGVYGTSSQVDPKPESGTKMTSRVSSPFDITEDPLYKRLSSLETTRCLTTGTMRSNSSGPFLLKSISAKSQLKMLVRPSLSDDLLLSLDGCVSSFPRVTSTATKWFRNGSKRPKILRSSMVTLYKAYGAKHEKLGFRHWRQLCSCRQSYAVELSYQACWWTQSILLVVGVRNRWQWEFKTSSGLSEPTCKESEFRWLMVLGLVMIDVGNHHAKHDCIRLLYFGMPLVVYKVWSFGQEHLKQKRLLFWRAHFHFEGCFHWFSESH